MEFNKDKRIFLQIGSILGMLQGLAWSIMSLISIAVYLKQPELKYEEDMSYARFISLTIYYRFFYTDDSDSYKETIINPTEFQIFMWFYLVTNLCWLVNSYLLFLASRISSPNSTKQLERKLKFWAGNSLIVSLLDFIFVCLLGRDYGHCEFSIKMDEISFGLVCHTTMGVVLTLVAKGFVLWIINFGFALTTSYFRYNMTVQSPLGIDVNNGPQNFSIPRVPKTNIKKPAPAIPFVGQSDYGQPEMSTMQPHYGQERQQPIHSYGQRDRLPNHGSFGQTNLGYMNSQSGY